MRSPDRQVELPWSEHPECPHCSADQTPDEQNCGCWMCVSCGGAWVICVEHRGTCGHECIRTEPERSPVCDCIRCGSCSHWISKCDTPEVCEYWEERDEWLDGEGYGEND